MRPGRPSARRSASPLSSSARNRGRTSRPLTSRPAIMKVRLPLTPEASPRGGTITFRPVVHIEVLRRDGTFRPLRFRVDTGADVTSIPFLVADALGVQVTDHDRTERPMYGVG